MKNKQILSYSLLGAAGVGILTGTFFAIKSIVKNNKKEQDELLAQECALKTKKYLKEQKQITYLARYGEGTDSFTYLKAYPAKNISAYKIFVFIDNDFNQTVVENFLKSEQATQYIFVCTSRTVMKLVEDKVISIAHNNPKKKLGIVVSRFAK